MFKELDKDGTGKVSVYELKKMLEGEGCKLSKDAVARLVAKFDVNKDGELNLEELCKLLGWLKNAQLPAPSPSRIFERQKMKTPLPHTGLFIPFHWFMVNDAD